ncbi:MAG: 7TM diverse intracellular signaling domain-containing protein [Bacteroidota bacterium]
MLVLTLAVFSARAQSVVLDPDSEEIIVDGRSFYILNDESEKLRFSDILNPETQKRFVLDGRTTPLTPSTGKSCVWLKSEIHIKDEAGVKPNWLIEMLDGHIGSAEYFVSYPDGSRDSARAGATELFGIRRYKHKNFLFDIDLQSHKQATVYLRIRTKGPGYMVFKVRSVPRFVYYTLNEYILLGLYYGMLIIMVLYNLFIFLSVREKLYIYYILYFLSCAAVSLMEDGLGFQYLWPEYPWVNGRIAQFAPFMLLITFYLFSRRFLGLKAGLPKLHNVIALLIAAYSLTFVLDVFFRFWRFSMFPWPFILIYVAAIILYRRGNRTAVFFIAGFSVALLGIIEGFLHSYNLLNINVILRVYSFNLGVLAEILFFSYALSDRLRVEKENRNKAQKEMIKSLQENEALKDDLNRKLESRVKDRTTQLALSNEQLENALKQVHEQAAEIRRINMLLKEENTELKSNLTELTKARVLHREVNLSEFTLIFPEATDCYKFLEQLKWKAGYSCRRCGHAKHCSGKEALSRRCTKCRYEESVTGGTIFHRLKFPITKAFYLLFLVYANKRKISSTELSEILDLRQKTCWAFSKKVEDAWDLWKGNPANADRDLEWENLIMEPAMEEVEE